MSLGSNVLLTAGIFVRRAILPWSVILLAVQGGVRAELKPQTSAAWATYVRLTEKRIAAELDHGQKFLVTDFLGDAEAASARAALRAGRLYIRKMRTVNETGQEIPVDGGMIHQGMGSIFLPGVRLDSVLRWVQDYDQHYHYFQEVEKSKLLSRQDPQFRIFLRLRRKKIITVFYNTEHTAIYRRYDARRVSSRSFTTKIAELEKAGTPGEKEKPMGSDSGFLWRLNSYWRFQEEDRGVYVECESISLSRGIPFGLNLLIRGYVESVPRESLENTLTSIRGGMRKTEGSGRHRTRSPRWGSSAPVPVVAWTFLLVPAVYAGVGRPGEFR
ncbi:MAG: hypothetical protein HY647_08675 [Acidobacteria bacterium]|nr:hypothetical protein [Acidobacteriota bacterium]